jgi:zinc and cadmium transporter
MTPFSYALFANIIIALFLLILIFVLRNFKNKIIRFNDFFTALTVWLLLWIVFFMFLPTIVKWLAPNDIWIYILIWLFSFYILELFLHFHHCKDLENKKTSIQKHTNEKLIFVWTLLHNMLHWIILFSAFSVNIDFWITLTMAILIHSIPQNITNYLMNHNNEKLVLLAAIGWILWILILFPFGDFLIAHKTIILSLISWWLLYLALSDILPEFKNKWRFKYNLLYMFLVLIWAWIVFMF